MSQRDRNDSKRRRLLRRVRRQRLKYVTILPSLITLVNGICGFAAIAFASRGDSQFTWHRLDFSSCFAVSGYLIFVAMIADMLDGRVARMSHATSSFGGQLDSLCDMVSFGVAPAFIVLKVSEYKLMGLISPASVFSGFVIRFVWLSAGVYVVCAAIRLARFNVENEEDETAHMSFIGLPSPAAAGVLASIVILHDHLLAEMGADSLLFRAWEVVIVYLLPFIAIGTGVLMVSRIRYPHLINQFVKGRKPITHLMWTAAIFALVWQCLQPTLVVSFCGFALIGFLRWFYYRVVVSRFTGNPSSAPSAPSAPSATSAPPATAVPTPSDTED